MKQILLLVAVSFTAILLHSCGVKESPTQFIQNCYKAICNGQFEELGTKLELADVRKAVFEDHNKKVIDFFHSEARQTDKETLAGLFEVTAIEEHIAEDKQFATINYKLKINGGRSYTMQANLTKGKEGWKICPTKGALDFLGYEDVLLYLPTLDNNLSGEELAAFQKEPQNEVPEDFHCGRAAVKPKERDKAADFIDLKGNKIFSTKFNALFSDQKEFKLGLLGDKDINGNAAMSKRTAHAFPINKLQLFMPEFNWKDANADQIFYTDLRKSDVEIAALSWKYGTEFVYGNKRLFDYGQTDDRVLFEGFRGADGNFKIIRYR
ncbi:hypothetical protein [Mangrovibacterium marinum]|uniref:Uncharacterized protein n=1 Tax=Mangrovibacterium marinum TaxID=1639118 RepID=A0A2T5C2W3_9BACT|nr:hypothetical protein [Mangrovibacterium marinum]PTN09071.1 hypothetical protein C8N47_106171 [Mangrovibacterium marinum]